MKEEPIHEETYRGLTIKIYYDTDTESPREWDNLGTMVCAHSRYTLGDKQIDSAETFLMERLEEHFGDSEKAEKFRENHSSDECLTEIEKSHVMLPLFLYDHGGITMNTKGFSCPWDSGQVGYIYVIREKILEEYNKKILTKKLRRRIEGYLASEVETYDDYLQGNVYGYVIEDKDGNHLDSYWGFFPNREDAYLGSPERHCLEEARNAANHEVKAIIIAHCEKVKTWIRNKVGFDYRTPNPIKA